MLNTQYESGSTNERYIRKDSTGWTKAYIQTKTTTDGYKARVVVDNLVYGEGLTSKVLRANVSVPMAKEYVATL